MTLDCLLIILRSDIETGSPLLTMTQERGFQLDCLLRCLLYLTNSEFVSTLCRRNTFQNFSIPRYTRESPALFVCSCVGGARPKTILDPFGYHTVECKIGANAMRLEASLHDEVVFILAKLFRVVEPLRIFSDAAPEAANQRPDILLRNPRGFGRQVILET